ncbi:inner membrane protein yciS [Acrasis kona]|uniref:Inner membrane protein yciS n=1 Tax=Acrasis kona TaxID=1008807 RepID=A0AAW2ZA34_9EUKA
MEQQDNGTADAVTLSVQPVVSHEEQPDEPEFVFPFGIFRIFRNLCILFSVACVIAWLVMGGLWLRDMNNDNKPNINSSFWSAVALTCLYFLVVLVIILFHQIYRMFERRAVRTENIRHQIEIAASGPLRDTKKFPFFGYSAEHSHFDKI